MTQASAGLSDHAIRWLESLTSYPEQLLAQLRKGQEVPLLGRGHQVVEVGATHGRRAVRALKAAPRPVGPVILVRRSCSQDVLHILLPESTCCAEEWADAAAEVDVHGARLLPLYETVFVPGTTSRSGGRVSWVVSPVDQGVQPLTSPRDLAVALARVRVAGAETGTVPA